MGSIAKMELNEAVKLNGFHMAQLYEDLGAHCAERVVQKALADIAQRLTLCEAALATGNLTQLRKQARALSSVAAQIGLAVLQPPVAHMLDAAAQADAVACQATLSRLQRLVCSGLEAATDLQRSRWL
ncbi:hypothetical protein [Thalassovita mediterranea]|jgi:HPt (histidine-containing phosphotransfer) domain-containing protein|uniref:HPt domain-containing protein n=1 Tax=Thalassovita mediterranea TaxID=340021 RepID=A0A0N7M271_9RHOB|nr:hypothetical protein [Thalassovita mediterranea]CUH85291.1 hypothetical protein TM5383_02519 [Thalassovita mediterranea]SIS30506.1 hypothetical protein SAMN05421685_10398 [Thalassovita mediterranea]